MARPHNTRAQMVDSFESRYTPEPNSGCWLWLGPTTGRTHAYGAASWERKKEPAHRVAWKLFVGPIPDGMSIDHLCRTPLCVNPAHLEPVTQRENLMRGDTRARENANKTHCKRGHEFTAANTRKGSKGERLCIECERNKKREHERKKRALRVLRAV